MKFVSTIINNPEYAPKCFIHTIQVFIPETEVTRWEKQYNCKIESLQNGKPYINAVNRLVNGAYIIINTNRAYNRVKADKYDNITSLERYKQAIDYIISDMHIMKWHYNRIDIAFDIPIITDDTFSKLYNINHLLTACICYYKNKDYNFFSGQNGTSNTKNSITIKNHSNMHFEIYDKHLQSNAKFKTVRIEFRYLKLNERKNNSTILNDCINNTRRILRNIKKQELYVQVIEHYKQTISEYANNLDFTSKPKVQQRKFISIHNNLFIINDIYKHFYNNILNLGLNDEQIKQAKKNINNENPDHENITYNLYQKYCKLLEKSIDNYTKE